MDNLEKVEKLRERADVSYEEAKAALEESDWDMLDALVKLESQGKVKEKQETTYSTKSESDSTDQQGGQQVNNNQYQYNRNTESGFSKLWRGICTLVRKGLDNSLVLRRHGMQVMEIPVILFILLLAVCFWVVLPLMVISLFFDCAYSFRGADLGKESVNNAMNQASKMANDIKVDVTKNNDNK